MKHVMTDGWTLMFLAFHGGVHVAVPLLFTSYYEEIFGEGSSDDTLHNWLPLLVIAWIMLSTAGVFIGLGDYIFTSWFWIKTIVAIDLLLLINTITLPQQLTFWRR